MTKPILRPSGERPSTRPNKLTVQQKREIVAALVDGRGHSELARQYHVAPSLIAYYEKNSYRYEPTDDELDRMAAGMPPVEIT